MAYPWCVILSYYLFPHPTKLAGGILDSPWLSICPSVCTQHGFRSISHVCFGISISNFICMLMVAIGRSILIFSNVTFKMVACWPYWIFWFPASNFSLALNIFISGFSAHNTVRSLPMRRMLHIFAQLMAESRSTGWFDLRKPSYQ